MKVGISCKLIQIFSNFFVCGFLINEEERISLEVGVGVDQHGNRDQILIQLKYEIQKKINYSISML